MCNPSAEMVEAITAAHKASLLDPFAASQAVRAVLEREGLLPNMVAELRGKMLATDKPPRDK